MLLDAGRQQALSATVISHPAANPLGKLLVPGLSPCFFTAGAAAVSAAVVDTSIVHSVAGEKPPAPRYGTVLQKARCVNWLVCLAI